MRLLPLMLCLTGGVAYGQGFTATVSGPMSVHVGYSTYVSVMPEFTDARSSIYWVTVEAPRGITGTMVTRLKKPDGTLYAWYGPEIPNYGPFEVQISAAASVAPGTYPISIVTQRHGIEVRLPYSITVKPVEVPVFISDTPPVLALGKWESTFRALGAKWCKADEAMLFGYEGQVWFYDGGRVYLLMADYFQDPSWEQCAYNILRQYSDAILARNYWGAGWRVFSKGLRMAYERTGDARYRDAIHVLATASPFSSSGGGLKDTSIRETAFILQAYVDDERVGNGRHPNMTKSVAYLLAHFEALFETGNFLYHQTFMDGLAAQALIDYYELTKDPRIPGVIRTMLDWIWEKGWDKDANKLVYNPEPLGPRCNVADGGCQVYTTNMINLVVPAFAWYWSITGDSTIRERGDVIFSHALDTDISYSGKIFSQNYQWSPSFVAWRLHGSTDQSGAPCAYALQPGSQAFSSQGGISSFSVVAPSGCNWAAVSGAEWVTLSGQANGGKGPATVSFTVAQNTGAARSATVSVADQTFRVDQASGVTCTYTLSAATASFAAPGGDGTLTISAPASCTWMAHSDSEWISIRQGETGNGSGTISYLVGQNAAPGARSGTIIAAGRLVTITQSGAGGNAVILGSTTGAGGLSALLPVTLSAAQPIASVEVRISSTAAVSSNFFFGPALKAGARSFRTEGSDLIVNVAAINSALSGTVLLGYASIALPSGLPPGSHTVTATCSSPIPCAGGQSWIRVPAPPVLEDNEFFIRQQYQDIFSRAPTAAELSDVLDRLDRRLATRAEIATELILRPEFFEPARSLASLYRGALGREGEFKGWLDNMHAMRFDGFTFAAMADSFLHCPEYVWRYGHPDNTGFLYLLYRNVLERGPDPIGLRNNLTSLEVVGVSRTDMLLAFITSAEYVRRFHNPDFVRLVFFTQLRRYPDTTAFNTYLSMVESGTPKSEVLNAILQSSEYRARF